VSVVANVAINVDASKALGQLKAVDQASKGLDSGFKGAAAGAKGLGSAIATALGPLLAFSTAVATVQKGLTVAFERGAAEQRLKNLASSTGEYEAALGVAAATADKFGMSQTEATQALADVYGRLKGVGFGLKETSQIYDGFNAIAKQSGIAGADAAGVFFQLSQALGKGKLNGDEFVSVSERMPQLLDAIAQATGRSRGELSKMAQDGQITSEVLYKALSGSAVAAGDLNGKLTEQQKAFNALSQVSDRLLNSIGQAFAPVVIKGAEALAVIGQKLAEW
jgi:tape measure domain-containing protein